MRIFRLRQNSYSVKQFQISIVCLSNCQFVVNLLHSFTEKLKSEKLTKRVNIVGPEQNGALDFFGKKRLIKNECNLCSTW